MAARGPGDAKAVGRGADHAGDVDRDLDPSDIGERIVGAGIVVERQRAAIRGEVIGAQPVLADDDRIGGHAPDLLDETREVEGDLRSEEHTSELQSLMRISYAVFCLKKKKTTVAATTSTDK